MNHCRSVWQEAENGGALMYTSFFGFTEVFKAKCEGTAKPLSDEDDEKIEALLGQKWIHPIVVDETIAVSVFKQMGQMFGFAKGVFCSSFSCYAACR